MLLTSVKEISSICKKHILMTWAPDDLLSMVHDTIKYYFHIGFTFENHIEKP